MVPINDLAIKNNDLVAATGGRAFWILDDLSVLQQTKGMPDTTKITAIQPVAKFLFLNRVESQIKSRKRKL